MSDFVGSLRHTTRQKLLSKIFDSFHLECLFLFGLIYFSSHIVGTFTQLLFQLSLPSLRGR